MATPVDNRNPSVSSPSLLETVKGKTSSIGAKVHQTDLITQMEKARSSTPGKTKSLKHETDVQAKTFIHKASLYTTVSLLHAWSNVGQASESDDNKFRLIVKQLSKQKNPGFWSIRKAMKKYFPNLSFVRMFFLYYLFIGWLPKLYIKMSTEKILDFSRNKLKEGDNLPILGSNLIGVTNTYLANYNRTVQRFRDDSNNPIGDRDAYIRQELHKPEMLGYNSIHELHKKFALAASREDTRPAFRAFSNPIVKFQLLDFQFLKKYANPLRTVLMPFTLVLGLIPYVCARIIEFIPNRVIKKSHSSLIKYFMPTVLENTVQAVSQPGFTHAINSFLCDIIQDLRVEMSKKPEDKNIDEIPNVVNEALSQEIRKFSELLYTLLKREPYKSQEDLLYLKQHGSDPRSVLERILRLITARGYLDRSWITPIFVDALHLNIIDGFNLIFAQPEKLEEYLCNFMVMMNNVFDYVPDPNTEEGKALLEEQKERQKRRVELVDGLIEDGINLATDDVLNESMWMLSRHQKENLLVSYRRIKKKAENRLPDIAQNAGDILNSSGYVRQTKAQAMHAKEDIQRAIQDIERLFVAVSNVMSDENGPVKSRMRSHLKTFLKQEKVLKDSIIKINELHDQKQGLEELEKELRKLKHTLENLPSTIASQIEQIEIHLQRINAINVNHIFDPIAQHYQRLARQLEKTHRHSVFANELERLLTTTFFSNNFILTLAKAQKEYLQNPNSSNKEQNLVHARNKVQSMLKELEKTGEMQDVQEVRLYVRKILECTRPEQVSDAYKNTTETVRKKIAKHKSLHTDERIILPKYYDKCKVMIDRHLSAIPSEIESKHSDLIRNAEVLTVTIDQMQQSTKDIGKQKFTDHLDGVNVSKILASIASFGSGYLGWLGFYPAVGIGSTSAGSILVTPTGVVRKLASSAAVPLAKATANSGYGLITNQTFYEGLIHAYMRQFIGFVDRNKR